jgi:hypothetical protein
MGQQFTSGLEAASIDHPETPLTAYSSVWTLDISLTYQEKAWPLREGKRLISWTLSHIASPSSGTPEIGHSITTPTLFTPRHAVHLMHPREGNEERLMNATKHECYQNLFTILFQGLERKCPPLPVGGLAIRNRQQSHPFLGPESLVPMAANPNFPKMQAAEALTDS